MQLPILDIFPQLLRWLPTAMDYSPWYDNPHIQPFRLVRKIAPEDTKGENPEYHAVSLFPWTEGALDYLWNGSLKMPEAEVAWRKVFSQWWDAIAVGGTRHLAIHFARQKRPPICIDIPPNPDNDSKLIPADRMCVAWAITDTAPSDPLILFSWGSLLYIYSVVENGIAGYLRGHGGAITSIAVHPVTPHLACTTSRDHTTRVYDLKLEPQQPDEVSRGPVWPPVKRTLRNNTGSMAGASFGLPLVEGEGTGIGRCITVLVGGKSGGHQAAVLGAAFHPKLPILATCGMDRATKLWILRPRREEEVLGREDKPIFSTARIHKARVMSINWLTDDMLLTHSAPALMRKHFEPDDKVPEGVEKETYVEAGEITIWRWLGMDRFFPPIFMNAGAELQGEMLRTIRGNAGDYQDSSAFKVVSTHSFREARTIYDVPRLSLYQSDFHDPLIIYLESDKGDEVLIANVAKFQPRAPRLFPRSAVKESDPADGLAAATQKLSLGEITHAPPPPQIATWRVPVDSPLKACVMGVGGRLIVGVGEKSTVLVWSDAH